MTKVLVSIDEALLVRVDRTARAEGLSRSAWLARVAERAIETESRDEHAERARRALDRLDRLFAEHPIPEDPVRAVREMRDSR